MSYKVFSIPLFDKQAKCLAKKYPSLKNDLAGLIESLAKSPEQGKALGNNFIRSVYLLLQKEKGNQEERELLLM